MKTIPWARRTVMALCVGVTGIHGQAPAQQQQDSVGRARIVGRLVEHGGQRPIGGATVRLEGHPTEATTNDSGTFEFESVMAGSWVMTVLRLGFATRSDTIHVAPRQVLEVVASLSAEPIELEPIAVEVRSPALQRFGFYDRRQYERSGHFLTEAEIERRRVVLTSDLFARMPRVRVEDGGPGRKAVVFVLGYPCKPALFVDGVKWQGDADVDRLNPSEIAGIEVYPGAITPLQYRATACGAIVMWTKRDD